VRVCAKKKKEKEKKEEKEEGRKEKKSAVNGRLPGQNRAGARDSMHNALLHRNLFFQPRNVISFLPAQ